MKAIIIQLWALLCLVAQGFFELVCVLAQETANLFNQPMYNEKILNWFDFLNLFTKH